MGSDREIGLDKNAGVIRFKVCDVAVAVTMRSNRRISSTKKQIIGQIDR